MRSSLAPHSVRKCFSRVSIEPQIEFYGILEAEVPKCAPHLHFGSARTTRLNTEILLLHAPSSDPFFFSATPICRPETHALNLHLFATQWLERTSSQTFCTFKSLVAKTNKQTWIYDVGSSYAWLPTARKNICIFAVIAGFWRVYVWEIILCLYFEFIHDVAAWHWVISWKSIFLAVDALVQMVQD